MPRQMMSWDVARGKAFLRDGCQKHYVMVLFGKAVPISDSMILQG